MDAGRSRAQLGAPPAPGVVPTPHGAIIVRWRRGRDDSSSTLTVIAPRHTAGAVDVPLLGRSRIVALDAHIAWDGRRARGAVAAHPVDGGVAFVGINGSHSFAWGSR
jgi:alpha-L-rhamnosidase